MRKLLFLFCWQLLGCQTGAIEPASNLKKVDPKEQKHKAFSHVKGEAAKKSNSYGFIVDAERVKEYRHLKKYTDSIVLGNANLQFVFSNIPLDVPRKKWQQAILAVFQNNENKWIKNSLVDQIDLKRLNNKGRFFYPIAVDLGEELEGYSYLTVIYTESEGVGTKLSLTWRVLPEKNMLFLVTSPLHGNQKFNRRHHWQLRVHSRAAVSSTKLVHLASNRQPAAHKKDSNFALFKNEKDSLAVLGFQDFNVKRACKLCHFYTSSRERSKLNGYTFFFGASSSTLGKRYGGHLQACRYRAAFQVKRDLTREEQFLRLQECIKKAGKKALVLKGHGRQG